jgi:hypothetical protein
MICWQNVIVKLFFYQNSNYSKMLEVSRLVRIGHKTELLVEIFC